MMRVFVNTWGRSGETLPLDEAEARHILQVRRADPEEPVEILDGMGRLARATLLPLGKGRASVQVLEELEDQRESPLDLQLVLAIPVQLATLDDLLPGLVQVGCRQIRLVVTDYGGRIKKDREHYFQRLRSISIQALKQCGRTQLPKIQFDSDWSTCCHELAMQDRPNLLFHPGARQGLGDLTYEKVTGLNLCIGPEGGFSEPEVTMALAQGFTAIALGPRFLKLETAALGVCFWAQALYGDFSGN